MFSILFHHFLNPIDLGSAETSTSLKPHGVEPELCLVLIPLDMDVRRLIPIPCEEKEPVRANSQYRGHCSSQQRVGSSSFGMLQD